MHEVGVPDGHLTVASTGTGEPILFVQTALVADELAPVAMAAALDDHHRIVVHRRGYGTASPALAGGTIADEAADCRDLLAGLGIDRAHVVGLSWAGTVALQLAVDHPAAVQTLTLVEPAPVVGAAAHEFRAANRDLLDLRRLQGVPVALEAFLAMVDGPDWRATLDRLLPGAVAQAERDAATFFDHDLPALLDWRFDAADAARVRCPVQHVGGTTSGPWFAAVVDCLRDWFPDMGDVVVDDAGHDLALTHADDVATAVASFVGAHPLAGSGADRDGAGRRNTGRGRRRSPR